MMHARSTILDVLVDMSSPRTGDCQEDIFRRHAGAQLSGEVVADRLTNAEPSLAGGHGIQHVWPANPARRAIERAGTAGMRVGVHQHGARKRIGLVSNDRMADALISADIVQPLD